MKTVTQKEKIAIVLLCIWSFLHTYILINNITGHWITSRLNGLKYVKLDKVSLKPSDLFFPFTLDDSKGIPIFEFRIYDYSEYFVYVGGVWMIYLLYRYLNGSNLVGVN